MIRVYNTLTKQKEEFVPVTENKVGIYLCGPTVYKQSHVGHLVGPVIFDAIKRYLRYNGFDVRFIINITDVDDKLIVEANRRNVPMKAIADEMTADYMRNLTEMGVDSVDEFPKATDFIPEIISFTQRLIEKGFAYPSEGDVYFNVAKFTEYGKLSHRTLEHIMGEGGGTADRKQSHVDFALWKAAKPNEPSWESPWGFGRPGWHIECSVMSCELLGETFDIHGGGLDLVFPHHENEIAQSEAAFGKPMAKYWLHNGLMQASSEIGKVGGKHTKAAAENDLESQESGKISKSKGSAPFRDLLAQFPAETIRFFLLSSHYRRPIDFSLERISGVGTGLETFYRFFKRYSRITRDDFYKTSVPLLRAEGEFDPQNDALLKAVHEHRRKFLEFMDDDFNTGGAVGVLFDLLRILNKYVDDEKLELAGTSSAANEKTWLLVHGATVLRELGLTLGLFRFPQTEKQSELTESLMALLIRFRKEAKAEKNFAFADKIRTGLKEIGITLEDRPGGETLWEK